MESQTRGHQAGVAHHCDHGAINQAFLPAYCRACLHLVAGDRTLVGGLERNAQLEEAFLRSVARRAVWDDGALVMPGLLKKLRGN